MGQKQRPSYPSDPSKGRGTIPGMGGKKPGGIPGKAVPGNRPGYGKVSPPGMGGAKRPAPGKVGIPGPKKPR